MSSSMVRIDVHHHILPTHYVETVGAHVIGSQGSSGKLPFWSLENSLEKMDEAGISTAVVSVSSPGLPMASLQQGLALAQWCNDFSAGMVGDHPTRFGFFATLPLQSIDAAIAEATRSLDSLQADGLCLLTHHEGRYLGDAFYAPLYEELNRRKAVVFVHPTAPQTELRISGMSLSMMEFPFDTTRTIASLLFEGVAAKYPAIRWIFSHGGGCMPYLAGRLEILTVNNPALRQHVPNGVYAALQPFYFDTALSATPTHFGALTALVPETQILLGTDYPFGPRNQMAAGVEGLKHLGLADDVQAAILGGNALKLFPRLQALIG